MAEIEFIFNNIKLNIQCNINEKMKDICNRFAISIGKDINKIIFIYDGKVLNEDLLELSFIKNVKDIDRERKKINLFVYEKELKNEKNKLNNNNKLEELILNDNKKEYNKVNKISDNINEIKIIYKINKNEKEIKLFGFNFIDNNKDKCKLIYENKEYELKAYFSIKERNIELLEIKLNDINNVSDMSHMFDGCSSLLSLPDISK